MPARIGQADQARWRLKSEIHPSRNGRCVNAKSIAGRDDAGRRPGAGGGVEIDGEDEQAAQDDHRLVSTTSLVRGQ